MELKKAGSKGKRHQKKGQGAAEAGCCDSCIHKRNLRVGNVTFDRVQCCHPKVMEIQERYPERKPGLIAAKALNEMGKALNPVAYRNQWFSWPYCYGPAFIEFCSGFQRIP
jgi:hypothetical protein